MTVHGVGLDVADTSRVSRLLAEHGDRFRSRWFTPAELDQCDAEADPPAALAGRFAAKEAVWKALGLNPGGPLAWRSIAILDLDGSGRGRVELSGGVADEAARAGAGRLLVTVTAGGGVASAFAVAERAPGPPA